MYKATLSFTTNDYDVRKNQILADDFTTQDQIDEFLRIGYIVVYEDTLEITQNGLYDVEDYQKADVDIPSNPPDWTKIGYEETPQVVIDDFNYSKNIYDNWENVQSLAGKYKGNKILTYMPAVDTSNCTNMNETFKNCTNLKTVPLLNTSNVGYMTATFEGCSNLKTLTLLDTSNVTTMQGFCRDCSSLTILPQLNTSNVTNMYLAFSGCASLTALPLLDTSNVTNMSTMFSSCASLTILPQLNTSNVTNMSTMLQNCEHLTEIPQLDTGKVTNMSSMLYGCIALTTLPILDTGKVTNFGNFVGNCPLLSNESLNNILKMCINATSYTRTKNLYTLGLSSTQATTCQSLSNWNDFVEAGWSTGY